MTSAHTDVLALQGANLRYEVAGDGPAVVLVHGFGLDMRMWDPQLEQLTAHFRAVRYDCRGFGSSGLSSSRPWSAATRASTGSARTRTRRTSGPPSKLWKNSPYRPWLRPANGTCPVSSPWPNCSRDIPGAEKAWVPGAGHMANMEQPTIFNELLTRFLNGLPPPTPPKPAAPHMRR